VRNLIFNSNYAHGSVCPNVGNSISAVNQVSRIGIFRKPFFLTDTYTLLRANYTTDSGRGGHVTRDSGFFFNMGDSGLAAFFLSYYSSFFYGLVNSPTPHATATRSLETPLSASNILSGAGNTSLTRRSLTLLGQQKHTGAANANTVRNLHGASAPSLLTDSDDVLADVLITPQISSSAIGGTHLSADTLGRVNYGQKRGISTLQRNNLGYGSKGFGFFSKQATASSFDAPVFQMKPGYLGLWRRYRALFAKYSPLRYFRQRR
jgi:hypothetical protein